MMGIKVLHRVFFALVLCNDYLLSAKPTSVLKGKGGISLYVCTAIYAILEDYWIYCDVTATSLDSTSIVYVVPVLCLHNYNLHLAPCKAILIRKSVTVIACQQDLEPQHTAQQQE